MPPPKSNYPMVEMSEAERIVLETCVASNVVEKPLSQALGHVTATTITSLAPVPTFPTSIMDGYAVVSSDGPGEYEVVGHCTAGVDPTSIQISPGTIAYVATGGPVPPGADAVIPIEQTDDGSSAGRVRITGSAKPGLWVRQIGSDCEMNQVVVDKGESLQAAELGLCAMVGVSQVRVHAQPIVGVLSTGDELVDPALPNPPPGKIRDSNRLMLLGAIAAMGYHVIDLGIAPDTKEGLTQCINKAHGEVDVLVTSGGVSMGSHDLLKPLLHEIGSIHFGRLNMKPGKPTTFATVDKQQQQQQQSVDGANTTTNSNNDGNNKRLYVFALPGNPVSALVTMALLVSPALKKISGLPLSKCVPVAVEAKISSDMTLDPERPEYHRVVLSWDMQEHCYTATSTGGQRSSRLLSLRSANGLVCLPAGQGVAAKGSLVRTVMLPFFRE